jgi:hypothetical protein
MAANRYAREMGCKIETRHGRQFYCRVTAPIGSRLTEKQCLTVEHRASQAKYRPKQDVVATGRATVWTGVRGQLTIASNMSYLGSFRPLL